MVSKSELQAFMSERESHWALHSFGFLSKINFQKHLDTPFSRLESQLASTLFFDSAIKRCSSSICNRIIKLRISLMHS